jgi:hypothetical protein
MSSNRDELRKKLREKLDVKKIERSSKKTKDSILKDTMEKMGVDSDKLRQDLEKVNKENGFSIKLNNN